MTQILFAPSEEHITQDDAYEIDLIKSLIINDRIIEAIVFANDYSAHDDSLDVKQHVVFTVAEACELLKLSTSAMLEYIKYGKINCTIMRDFQCYVSLQSLFDFLRNPPQ